MSVMTDIKNTVDATPFFAAVGATDLAVEKVREARIRAEKVRVELSADLAPAKVQARATTLVDGVNLAVERFESQHPTLTGTLRNILQSLANMGI